MIVRHEPRFIEQIATKDNLLKAWGHVRNGRKRGSPDLRAMKEIEDRKNGSGEFVTSIRDQLLDGTYTPEPVRRQQIEKAPGEYRNLGIPTIRDRVAQYAVAHVIEPSLEKTFSNDSFGFRPHRTAHDALAVLEQEIQAGNGYIVEVDLTLYFDTIPHNRLLELLYTELRDESIVELISRWLSAGVMVEGELEPSLCGAPQADHCLRCYRTCISTNWINIG
ncbi:reverse transcriptase domain-containing protein [Alicyclobacillus dauci]|uniref:Reverse transcriptase domain-containing protein n=1 Tax=Alicyclobacillus dauci TaxID=1475485 RepID=A0ABY6Z270_9BACL|nr:reverse transcriptase domain-containing protein [Alicyclobacillus dauci]WAH36975.1 reverse transcriptase domain-containing protein [Alicyclobacillus dauci]